MGSGEMVVMSACHDGFHVAKKPALVARPGHRLFESDSQFMEVWPGSRSGTGRATRGVAGRYIWRSVRIPKAALPQARRS